MFAIEFAFSFWFVLVVEFGFCFGLVVGFAFAFWFALVVAQPFGEGHVNVPHKSLHKNS